MSGLIGSGGQGKAGKALVSFPVITRFSADGRLTSPSYMFKQLSGIKERVSCDYLVFRHPEPGPEACDVDIPPSDMVFVEARSTRVIDFVRHILSIAREINGALDKGEYKTVILFEPLLQNALVCALAKRRGMKVACWILGDHMRSFVVSAAMAGSPIDKLKIHLKRAMTWAILRYLWSRSDVIFSDHSQIARRPKAIFLPSPTFGERELSLTPKSGAGQRETMTILFVGRVVPLKRVELIIEAVEAAGGAVRAIIVGPLYGDEHGAYEFKIRALIAAKGLENKITLTGNISGQGALEKYYIEADIVALPSLTEGTPKVIFEAMAHGAPVVASRVGGIPDIVRDGVDGVLFNPERPEEFIGAIVALSKDRGRLQAMGAKAAERAGEFTKERIFGELAANL